LATKATGGERRPKPRATGRARCSSARMATRRPGGPGGGHPSSRDAGQKRHGVSRGWPARAKIATRRVARTTRRAVRPGCLSVAKTRQPRGPRDWLAPVGKSRRFVRPAGERPSMGLFPRVGGSGHRAPWLSTTALDARRNVPATSCESCRSRAAPFIHDQSHILIRKHFDMSVTNFNSIPCTNQINLLIV
jgi:hypothetical protein